MRVLTLNVLKLVCPSFIWYLPKNFLNFRHTQKTAVNSPVRRLLLLLQKAA